MLAITKQATRLRLQFVANTDHSVHAGLVAVEALARPARVGIHGGGSVGWYSSEHGKADQNARKWPAFNRRAAS